MAIVVEGTPTIYESASTSSAVIPYPSGITAGELLVAVVGTSTVTAPTTVPSGWTLTKAQNGNNAISVSMWHKVASGSESGTESFGTTSGRTTGHMFRLSGVDGTTPVDATAVGAGAPVQATFTMPTITTATNGAMLIHGIVLNASNRTTNDIVTLSGTTLVGITADAGVNGGRITGAYSETRATAGATGTRVWSKTGGTTLQWAGITAAFRPGAGGGSTVNAVDMTATAEAKIPVVTNGTGPTPVLNRCVQGVPTTTTHRIKVNTTDAGTVRIKAGTNSAVTTGVVWGDAITPDGNSNSELTISGLTANTAYYYRIAMTNSVPTEFLDTWTDVGQFKTDLDGQMDFSFAFGSCTNNSDSASLGAIAVKKPDLFFHLGDEYYADASGTSVSNFRTKMGDKLTVTNHKAVYRTSGATWLPSDHDGMNNNGNYAADATAWTNWNQVYREMKPTDGIPGGGMGVYRTFKRGRIRFIAIDRRSFAVAAGNTDNSSKTCLGTTQKQWFKDQIDAATEPVIVVINSDPWVITTDTGDDGWGGYITERDELAAYIAASGKNVAFLAGDMHAVAAADDSATPGSVYVFQAAPFYQNASIKGGPYDVGPYPASGTSVVQQYGWMDVDDNGTSISLIYKGFSSDNTQRVTLTATYDVPQSATVAAIKATATATDIVPTVTAAVALAHTKATATSQEGTPAVTALAVVAGVRAQASSTALVPAVTTLGAVAGVRAQASSTAIAPTVLGAQVATVAAVVFTASATDIAPTVTTIGALTSVVMTGSAMARVPGVGVSPTTLAVDSTATALALPPAVTTIGSLTAVKMTGSASALAPVATSAVTIVTPDATASGSMGTPVATGDQNTVAVVATGSSLALPPTVTSAVTIAGPASTATAEALPVTVTAYAGVVTSSPTMLGAAGMSAPVVTTLGNVAAELATVTSELPAPVVGGDGGVVAPSVDVTAEAYAPAFTGSVLIQHVAATATADVVTPVVTGLGGIFPAVITVTAVMPVPGVLGGGVVDIAAETATATAAAYPAEATIGIIVGAPAMSATSATPEPVVSALAVVQSVTSSANANARVPAVFAVVAILATRMVATATDRNPAVSAVALANAVVALATAVAYYPHLGGDKEFYLKDGTRLRPYMLIGGILVPVDPQF